MSPIVRWSRSISSGLRVAVVVVLLIALVGAWLPSSLAGAAPDRPISQAEPEQSAPPEQVDGGEASQPPVDAVAPVVEEQAPPAPVVEQTRPPVSDPPTPAPVETTEPEPVPAEPTATPSPTPPPTPEPTPDPWGPTQIRLSDPLVAPVVPAGSETTWVLEIDHLGAGGPDAKELLVDAPAGWPVQFAPAVAGEKLSDNDGDGWPETRPLFVNDRTFVAVTITTPAGLTATSSTTFRVTATSFGSDQAAFRSWIDLSVTAVVPEPSASGPSESPEPSTSADPSPSGTESPSGDPSGSASVSPSESPSASASASPNASSSESASPSASASARASSSPPTLVSIADDSPLTLVPGETTTVRQGFTVGGVADGEMVTLAVHVTIDPLWPLAVEGETASGERAVGNGTTELSVEVQGGQPIQLTVQIPVPESAIDGTVATLDISAEVVSPGDESSDALIVGMGAGDTLAVDPVEASSSYDLVVESVAVLTVEGGARFGHVNVVGDIDPTTTGVASTADETGATYTQANAVMLTVDGIAGPWSISCGAFGDGGSAFAWRESGGTWQPFPMENGACLSGVGPATIRIDIRVRVDWGGTLGGLAADVTFTLQADGNGVAVPVAD